jgi:TonB family protein
MLPSVSRPPARPIRLEICALGLLLVAVTACRSEVPQRPANNPLTPPIQLASVLGTIPVRSKPSPVLPAAAKRAGVRGPVIVEVRVNESGSVTEARVLRGDPLLNDLATDAARHWTFEPFLFNDVATPIVYSIPINFKNPQP